MKSLSISISLLLLLCLFFGQLKAGIEQLPLDTVPEDSSAHSIFTILSNSEVFDMELQLDMKKLIKTKHEDEYQPAIICYRVDNQYIVDSVEVKPRGNSRRKICYLPPIKIKFPKDRLKDKGLKKYNTLKMVNHCRNSATNQSIILREFLIYKMYQLFTDSSFQVQLLNINYVDTSRKGKATSRYGFFIEHEDELADRIDGHIHYLSNVVPSVIDTFAYIQFCLFQMMIGNTDWQIRYQHNVKVIRPDSGRHMVVVPYDFDYCGMVNAYYAIPNKKLNLDNVRTRIYLGNCHSMEQYQPVIKKFISRKAAMYQLIDDFELLHKIDKKDMKMYLDDFYSLIDNPSRLESSLRWRCGSEDWE